MEYNGKLYGKFAGRYFDTGKTSEDWDSMEKRIIDLELEISNQSEGTVEQNMYNGKTILDLCNEFRNDTSNSLNLDIWMKLKLENKKRNEK